MSRASELNLDRETALSFVARILRPVLSFVFLLVLARDLGPSMVGVYFVILSVGRILNQFVDGIGSSLRKRVSEKSAREGRYAACGFVIYVGYVLVITGGTFVVDELFQTQSVYLADPFAIVAVVVGLGLFRLWYYLASGLGRPGFSVWVDTVRTMATNVVQIVGVLWFGFGPTELVYVFSAMAMVVGIVLYLSMEVEMARPTLVEVYSIYRFGKWAIPTEILVLTYRRLDTILVGALISSAMAGYLETASRLLLPATLFASSMSDPLQVKISAKNSLGENVDEYVEEVMVLVGILSVPMMFGAFTLSEQLMMTVYGSDYATAGPFLVGMAVYIVVWTYQFPMSAAFYGIDKMRISFKLRAISLVVYLVVSILFIDAFGVLAVIGASVVAGLIVLAGQQFYAVRLFDRFIVPRAVFDTFAAGAIMSIVVHYTTILVTVDGWGSLLMVVGIGAAIYATTLLGMSERLRERARQIPEVTGLIR